MQNNRVIFPALLVVLLASIAAFTFSSVVAQQTTVTQWEYLNLNYSQLSTLDTEVTLFELVTTDIEFYQAQFDAVLTEGCEGTTNLFDMESQKCIGENFKGQLFFMNSLGEDGWEFVQIDNTSTESTYQVVMIFKRLKQ